MQMTYDKEGDAAYIYIKYPIKNGEARKQVQLNENIILDFNSKGRLLGVEVLDASKLLDKKVLIKAKQLS